MSAESLKDTTTTVAPTKPPAKVSVAWDGEHRFDGTRQSGSPSIRMDASGKTGPSPVDTLLCALGACTGVDVVDILAKRRTPVEAFNVDIEGERFAGVPGRVTRIHLVYQIKGAGIEKEHALRAIELAVTKYCSVRDSLDPNMPITWELQLNA
ncbi:MAG TPA: OsmC family peroxiredoxin [Gemmatimonas aurantiaca]|uniref:OsmC-like protein n=2 Tax=Gemmatimonas aurantiaca TaxID=173480 RepID=C1ABH9_GEMAT|nr:OsmC family protein [Gemmatimonas aurantiaca]BAH39856.1 OsmC-like protein [Gemmatimonas aurantiaca T-27]HCT58132.1 OsmC family peroxiredoxin [Gemmatimonas aurantiaca]